MVQLIKTLLFLTKELRLFIIGTIKQLQFIIFLARKILLLYTETDTIEYD